MLKENVLEIMLHHYKFKQFYIYNQILDLDFIVYYFKVKNYNQEISYNVISFIIAFATPNNKIPKCHHPVYTFLAEIVAHIIGGKCLSNMVSLEAPLYDPDAGCAQGTICNSAAAATAKLNTYKIILMNRT